jgi:hypothetical protein
LSDGFFIEKKVEYLLSKATNPKRDHFDVSKTLTNLLGSDVAGSNGLGPPLLLLASLELKWDRDRDRLLLGLK